MDDHKPIDPLAIIAWAVSSTFGRIVAFAAACWAAVATIVLLTLLTWLVFGIEGTEIGAGVGDRWIDLLRALTVGSFLWWLALIPLGLLQVWGILSYATLGGLFLWFTKQDADPRVVLPATFLIQHIEGLRCVCLCHPAGWQHVGSPGVLVDLAIWLALGAVWVAWVVRERRRRPLLG